MAHQQSCHPLWKQHDTDHYYSRDAPQRDLDPVTASAAWPSPQHLKESNKEQCHGDDEEPYLKSCKRDTQTERT
jgi:hypothetical protein